MILQKEIRDKAIEWKVPPDTVDKDYVLGHFLSAFTQFYENQLVFKGGTCLRKCYFEDYRFSEDLDFTAKTSSFQLNKKDLKEIGNLLNAKTRIQFHIQEIKRLKSNNVPKGFQVEIKYWGANHSKNQRPLPFGRWRTKIKLEISTDELIILAPEEKTILHPYSDQLIGSKIVQCYPLQEVISEKLRALKQRSYTAPRDFYDIYHLTKDYTPKDWKEITPIFLKKMKHKGLVYNNPSDLLNEEKLENAKRAWESSIAHQIRESQQLGAEEIIHVVYSNIQKYLSNGQ